MDLYSGRRTQMDDEKCVGVLYVWEVCHFGKESPVSALWNTQRGKCCNFLVTTCVLLVLLTSRERGRGSGEAMTGHSCWDNTVSQTFHNIKCNYERRERNGVVI